MFLSITSTYTSENKSFDMKFVYNLTKPYIFVVYLLNIWSVFCKLLDTSYSKPGDIKLTGLALVKFDLQGVSLVHCGSLCSEDECCKEVLYNATSWRCIGSPFSDFKSTVNNLVEASYDGMSKYQKDRFDLNQLIHFPLGEEHRNSTVVNFLTLYVSPLKQTFYLIKTFNVFLLFYCLNSLLVI